MDFESNAKEGIAIDWPIRYKDLAPWYSYVEKFAGISGNRDGLAQLTDGEFMPLIKLNYVEQDISTKMTAHFKGKRTRGLGYLIAFKFWIVPFIVRYLGFGKLPGQRGF